MKRWSALLVVLILVGCSPKAEPTRSDPAPPPVQPQTAQAGAGQPGDQAPAPPPATPVRVEIPGGFRIGPLQEASSLRWLGSDRIAISHKQRNDWVTEAVSLAGGSLLPLLPESPQPFQGASQQSPDGTRIVLYGKGGAGRLVNRETGEERTLPVGYWAVAGFDAWSPDGSRYLVQSIRTDDVPGFYFFDPDGNQLSTFAEPGHFSLWAAWSPDGSRVAFLSVPLEQRYPRSPEEWEETPFAPRVGVLDPATGQARYGTLAGETFSGTPLWSPDGQRLATICGEAKVVRNAPPFEQYETTTLQGSRPCIIDPATMAVTPVGEPVDPDRLLRLRKWSPDGSALQAHSFTGSGWAHHLYPVASGSVPLAGEPFWVEGGMVLHRRASFADHLLLADGEGEVRRILEGAGRIIQVAVSPDRRHIAYLRSAGGSVYDLVLLSPQRIAAATPVELAPGIRLLTWLEASGPEGGGLLITDTTGRELLAKYSGALEVVGLREVGAPYPILPVMVAGGGSMGMHYEAYLYDPSTSRLERIPWGNTDLVVSRLGVAQVGNGVQTTHREIDGQGGWRERSVIWRYRDGALRPVAP